MQNKSLIEAAEEVANEIKNMSPDVLRECLEKSSQSDFAITVDFLQEMVNEKCSDPL